MNALAHNSVAERSALTRLARVRFLLGLSILLLSACAAKPELVIPETPKLVRVPVDRYVAIPSELIADCTDEAPKEQTYAEAKRLAGVRREYLAECTSRMRKIRALQPQPEAQP